MAGWEARVAPYAPILEIPVTATFGLLALFACLSIAYDLGKRLNQDAIFSASIAAVVFLMLQIDPANGPSDGRGSDRAGLFTAILIALVTVRVQKFFADRNVVIRLPAERAARSSSSRSCRSRRSSSSSSLSGCFGSSSGSTSTRRCKPRSRRWFSR